MDYLDIISSAWKILFAGGVVAGFIFGIFKLAYKVYEQKEIKLQEANKRISDAQIKAQKEAFASITSKIVNLEKKIESLMSEVFKNDKTINGVTIKLVDVSKVVQDASDELKRHLAALNKSESKIEVLESKLNFKKEELNDVFHSLKLAEQRYEEISVKVSKSEQVSEESKRQYIAAARMLKEAKDHLESTKINIEKSKLIKIGDNLYMFKKIETK